MVIDNTLFQFFFQNILTIMLAALSAMFIIYFIVFTVLVVLPATIIGVYQAVSEHLKEKR